MMRRINGMIISPFRENARTLVPLLLALTAQLAVATALSGCEVKNNATTTPSPSPVSTGITPVGQVSETGFYVEAITASSISYYLHQQSDFNTKCQVLKSETSITQRDIFCILDMQELDLYHQELKLNFNSPAGMCPYVRVRPYWFYDFQPSGGSITRSATITDGLVTSQPAQGDVSIDSSGTVKYCSYDYTSGDGPNCCEGQLILTTITTPAPTATSTPPPSVTTTVTKLGGKVANCIAGPGADFQTGPTGFPVTLDYLTGDSGVNEVLNIERPFAKTRNTNLYRSNYFPLTATTDFPANTSDIPTAMKGPTGALQANPYYEFGCLDEAADYIARIRLVIRSWDSIEEFTSKSNPYSSGNEPQYGSPWHDKGVWKDYPTNYPWKE
jgi:hypothetical protein